MRDFEFLAYLRRPKISAITGLVVSTQLLRVAKQSPPPAGAIPPLERMRDRGEQLREQVRARKQGSLKLRRPADRRFDTAWSTLYHRIEPWARVDDVPQAAVARKLLARVFPTKLDFLLWRFEAEWLHSGDLLDRIAKEELEADIIELAGESFWQRVLSAHTELGEVLGLEGEVELSAPVSVGEEVRALAKAIADYTRALAGAVHTDEQLDQFLVLVRPLDELRAQQRRGGSPAAAEGEPEIAEEGDLFDLEEAQVDLDEPLPQLDQDEVEAA